jgi:hypothetical protein
MIVWGALLNRPTGGRYNPATNTWTPVATGDLPDSRAEHSAIWTGSVMVVWGGSGVSGSVLGSGGRYDPATDTWLDTTTQAPSDEASTRRSGPEA